MEKEPVNDPLMPVSLSTDLSADVMGTPMETDVLLTPLEFLSSAKENVLAADVPQTRTVLRMNSALEMETAMEKGPVKNTLKLASKSTRQCVDVMETLTPITATLIWSGFLLLVMENAPVLPKMGALRTKTVSRVNSV